ncbi:hypothetical protein AS850_14915 [Frondihabitans sp. 762G35]|uniref:septum formation family protein n=1 Tax=Frondihabitans sp. 762G35 TaxID=1446794 RepID=UPI000D21BB15|nr:septum formation family protein [Frondihabitans sp. 762G35]ARC58375.1 hypothetical protein AS850_14915 [Frondihabitans sp. 762G35]
MTDDAPPTTAREVDTALKRLLPGAGTVVDDGAGPLGAGVLRLRIGQRRDVTVARASGEAPADSTAGPAAAPGSGWSIGGVDKASDEGAGQGILQPLDVTAEATAAEVAASLVSLLRSWVPTLAPGDADPGLLRALSAWTPPAVPQIPSITPASASPFAGHAYTASPFSTPPLPEQAWTATARSTPTKPPMSFAKRAVITGAVVVGGLLVLGGGAAGIALAATSLAGSSGSSATSGPVGAVGTTPVTDLRTGDCFDLGDASDTDGDVETVPCTSSHDSELFGIVTVPETDDESGRVAYDLADAACTAKFSDYVGTAYSDSDLDFDVLTPSGDAWSAGDRAASCYLTFDSPRSSSARDTGE